MLMLFWVWVKRLLFWYKSSLGLDITEAPSLYTTTDITGTISYQQLMTDHRRCYHTVKFYQTALILFVS